MFKVPGVPIPVTEENVKSINGEQLLKAYEVFKIHTMNVGFDSEKLNQFKIVKGEMLRRLTKVK
jgi:hypothetical protein